jgi:phosphoglycolate phosphatase
VTPSPAKRLFLFDMDGTLVDSLPDLATATNEMRALHGLPPLPAETVRTYIGNGIRLLAERAVAGTGVPVDAAAEETRAAYARHLTDATRPMPGINPLLRALRAAGHVLGIVTNKPAPHNLRLVEHLGWLPLFDVILAGGDLPRLKPDPAPILEAMRRTGFSDSPSAVWMVGDNYTDLEAARRAGVFSVYLENGYGSPRAEIPTLRLPNADALLARFLP